MPFLLLPLSTLIGYLLTGSFFLRSTTTLLCLALVLCICVVQRRERAAWWVVAAFALSFLGDYVLGHWGGSFEGFVSGVGLFLLAHLGYVGYSLFRGRLLHWLFWLLALVFGAYYAFLLRPAISDAATSSAVLAYILISCLSLAAAAGIHSDYAKREEAPECTSHSKTSNLWKILFVVGIASLLFSDLLIAQKRFLHDGTLYPMMMPTYFASQLFISAALICRKDSK